MASRCTYAFPIVLYSVTSRINDEERKDGRKMIEMKNWKELAGKRLLLKRRAEKCRSQTLVKKVERIVNTPVRRNSVNVAQTGGWKSRSVRLSLHKAERKSACRCSISKTGSARSGKIEIPGERKMREYPTGRTSQLSFLWLHVRQSSGTECAIFATPVRHLTDTTEGFINFRRWRYSSFRVGGADTRYRSIRHAMYLGVILATPNFAFAKRIIFIKKCHYDRHANRC